MTDFSIEPLHDEFGARITGIDLKSPLTEDEVESIREMIDIYSFLCFPGQGLNDEHQLAFTKSLGEPEEEHVMLGQTGEVGYFGTIGNVEEDGLVRGNEDKQTIFGTGNNMWHSDSSFRKVPTYVSIMSAHEVPGEGGATLFASQRAAYSRLSGEKKMEIDGLVAIHDYVFSRTKVHPAAVTPSHAASLPPVPQRVVRRNPRTHERSFFVGSHARIIEGWSEAKSRELTEGLEAEATGEEHIYSHQWQVGDFVIWDNRCLIHRGEGFDADKYRRYMRQTRVCGLSSTLDE
jgi:alpha-ketoglutarate-dependent 2,4-dichlorophenoxyacetate dioxygenase